jgi:hypothetical protein
MFSPVLWRQSVFIGGRENQDALYIVFGKKSTTFANYLTKNEGV